MSDTTHAEMQRLLSAEFESQGWEYDLNVGREIVHTIERGGRVDAAALARGVSTTWLERNDATRDDVAAAIGRAVGGRTPAPAESAATTILTINDNRHVLHMESGAQIANSQVNVGGTQINVHADGPKEEVLAGVAAIVRAGLDGHWDPDAAEELAAAIDARGDIGYEEVEGAVAEAAEGASPDEGRIKAMLQSVGVQGLGGALGTGIVTGLTHLLHALGLG